MQGIIVFIIAAAGAAFVLVRAAHHDGGDKRHMLVLKVVALLSVAAIGFAVKGLPLALMILFAVGGVTAIEIWRERRIDADNAATPRPIGGAEEAAALLGVALNADAEEIKSAHKKLIGQLHPDRGGTDYLAAKINDARRILLERREKFESAAAAPQDKGN